MPRLSVNAKKCLKSGQCTYLHPDLFREGPDGKSLVLVEHPAGEQIQAAEDAAEICPGMAITVEP